MPYTPEELLAMGRQEWNRAVAFESYEKEREPGRATAQDCATTARVGSRMRARKSCRSAKFLAKHEHTDRARLVQHYTLRPMPEYLRGARLHRNGRFHFAVAPEGELHSLCRSPSPKLGYFWRATAQDPRPTHRSRRNPGALFSALSFLETRGPDPAALLRFGANEGIGFYAEEMMLQSGLFDDSPHTREIIYNFMRLRALRVEVDVKLALGEFTLEQAAKYLEEKVPMDPGPRARKRSRSPPGRARPSPIRSANCRSSSCWRRRVCSREKSSICAPSTIFSGKTATCRSRSSAGSISAGTMRCRNNVGGAFVPRSGKTLQPHRGAKAPPTLAQVLCLSLKRARSQQRSERRFR